MNYIVLCNENYSGLDVIRSLGENGLNPIVIIIRNGIKVASKSRYIKKIHFVQNIEEAYDVLLKNYLNMNEKSFILTTNDYFVSFLNEHYDQLEPYFYFYNAGGKEKLNKFMDKNTLVELAKEVGFNVPQSMIIKKGTKNTFIEFPIITKSTNSLNHNWKDNFHICYNQEELDKFYDKITDDEVVIQNFIKKVDEVSYQGFCIDHGKQNMNTISTSQDYCLETTFSECGHISNCLIDDTSRKIDKIIGKIGFEGVYEVEFLVDEKGQYWFLEINFRNSGWAYASSIADMPLDTLWIKSTLANKINENMLKKIDVPFIAINEFADFRVRVLNQKMNIFKWIKIYKNAKCKYVYGRHDRRPFYSYIFSSLKCAIFKK